MIYSEMLYSPMHVVIAGVQREDHYYWLLFDSGGGYAMSDE